MFSEGNLPEIKLQFETQGFVHLRDVIPADIVARVRMAFDSAAGERLKLPQERKHDDGAEPFYDIPNILDVDPVFVDLVDLPTLFPVLLQVVGTDIQLNHTTARLFYPGPTFTAPWHSDIPHVLGVSQNNSLNFFVKAHLFFEDLAPDQGCLAFIPGSHRYPPGHPRPVIRDMEQCGAVVKTVPRAGDAILFNTHVLHMATDNRSPRVRKSLIYAYSHYWVKQYDNAVPAQLERYATTPQRKQLFGVDIEGIPYFNRRLDRVEPIPMFSTFSSAARKVFKRTLQKKM